MARKQKNKCARNFQDGEIPVLCMLQESQADYEPKLRTSTRSRSDNKHNSAPGREVEAIMIIPRIEVHAELRSNSADSSKEIRKKCRQLVCECHPEKWSEEFKFNENDGENDFKSIASE